ncbi:MAG: response regulator transcription factor [Bacteroidetes bacterium]|nr:response regulator transcription factor [Bacteroidota bacterium]MBS1933141.1 response regulator transcription factor [Bacteroidota bacterium]
MQPIRILIADDHKLLCELWTIILSEDKRFSVIGNCEDGRQAIELSQQLKPDIVIMDINMLHVSGVEATEEITRAVPSVKVIGVSAFAVPKYARQMILAGAKGYVTKNSSKEELINAIMQVHSGKKYICEEIKELLSEEAFSDEKPAVNADALTDRELEVIEEIKRGLSSREIAMSMNISMKTVEVHRHNILKKLNMRNSAALINFMNTQSNSATG